MATWADAGMVAVGGLISLATQIANQVAQYKRDLKMKEIEARGSHVVDKLHGINEIFSLYNNRTSSEELYWAIYQKVCERSHLFSEKLTEYLLAVDDLIWDGASQGDFEWDRELRKIKAHIEQERKEAKREYLELRELQDPRLSAQEAWVRAKQSCGSPSVYTRCEQALDVIWKAAGNLKRRWRG